MKNEVFADASNKFDIKNAALTNVGIILPSVYNGLTPTSKSVNCNVLFKGYPNLYKGVTLWTLFPGKNTNYAEGFGYAPAQDAITGELICYRIKYDFVKTGNISTNTTKKTTNELCVADYSEGKVYFESIDELREAVADPGIKQLENGQIYWAINGENSLALYVKGDTTEYGSYKIPLDKPMTKEELLGKLQGAFKGPFGIYNAYTGKIDPTAQNVAVEIVPSSGSSSEVVSKYTMEDRTTAAATALKYLTGQGTLQKISNEEYDALYKSYYLWKSNNGADIKYNASNYSTNANAFKYAVPIKEGGSVKWYEIPDNQAICSKDVAIRATSSSQYGTTSYSLKLGTFCDMLTDWKNIGSSGLELSGDQFADAPVSPTPTPTPDDSTTGNSDHCLTAASSLGWIICPVINVVGWATDHMYDWVISSFLEIPKTMFDDRDPERGVYAGWKIFRDISNTLFAIVFIIVILAQVTGIGISNYGIKKILPRLIVVVVMVNISFILCQLAVDVSNILGAGLHDFFIQIQPKVPNTSWIGGSDPNAGRWSIFATVMSLVVGVGGFVILKRTWETWLLPFLLVLLTAAVSMIFFFIILGVRQAGVIILAVFTPIAIICYALPNTKNIFDRWRKTFTSLLLVYPICGALTGGGKFASAILITAVTTVKEDGQVGVDGGGFFYMLVAMLVSVVPFFLIPSIVKNSLSAIGNIGAKISALGQRAGRGLSGAIRNSDSGKDLQRRWDMRNAEKTYNRLNNRAKRRIAAGKEVSDKLAHRIYVQKMRYNRPAYEDIRADNGAGLLKPGTAAYDQAVAKQKSETLATQVSGQRTLDAQNFSSLDTMEDELMRRVGEFEGNLTNEKAETEAYSMVDNLMEQGGSKGADRLARTLFRYAGQANDNQKIKQHYVDGAGHARKTATAMSKVLSYAKNRYGDKLKDKFPEFFKFANDMSQMDYSHAFGTESGHEDEKFQVSRDEKGNVIKDKRKQDLYSSSYYLREGAKIKGEQLGISTDDMRANLKTGIRNGTIQGKALKGAASAGLAVYGNKDHWSKMDADDHNDVMEIIASGVAGGAKAWTESEKYDSTVGSELISEMNENDLIGLENYIRTLNGGKSFGDVQDFNNWNDEQQRDYKILQGVAENFARTLHNDKNLLSEEKAARAKNIMNVIGAKGVMQMGNPSKAYAAVSYAGMKVDHTAP